MCNWRAIAIRCHVISDYINFFQKTFVHPMKKSAMKGRWSDTIYLCHESHGHIEAGGSMRHEDAEECICKDEEEGGNGSTVALKGTGFILRLRWSSTSCYADGWWWKWCFLLMVVTGGWKELSRLKYEVFAQTNQPCRPPRQYL